MHVPEVVKKTFKDFAFETLTSAAGSFISSFFEPIKQKAGEFGGAAGRQTMQKLFAEFRDEMFAWIHGEFADQNLGNQAHANFNRRWRMRQLRAHKPYKGPACKNFDDKVKTCGNPNCFWRYKPGDELDFVAVWTGAYKHLSDRNETEQRFTLFQYYFKLDDDQEFDIEMEQLVNDLLKQYGEKFWQFLRAAIGFTKEQWNKLENGVFADLADLTSRLPGARREGVRAPSATTAAGSDPADPSAQPNATPAPATPPPVNTAFQSIVDAADARNRMILPGLGTWIGLLVFGGAMSIVWLILVHA